MLGDIDHGGDYAKEIWKSLYFILSFIVNLHVHLKNKQFKKLNKKLPNIIMEWQSSHREKNSSPRHTLKIKLQKRFYKQGYSYNFNGSIN